MRGLLAVGRTWKLAGAAGTVLVLLAGWFLLISPQRQQAADLADEMSTAQLNVARLTSRLADLRRDQGDMARYVQQLADDRAALPATPGLADLLRQLEAAGGATGFVLTSMAAGQPEVVAGAGSAPAGSQPAGSQPAGSRPAAGGRLVGQTVFSIPITLAGMGSASVLEQFLDQIQTIQPRALLISSVNEKSSAADGGDAMTLQLTLMAFVLPADQAQYDLLLGGG